MLGVRSTFYSLPLTLYRVNAFFNNLEEVDNSKVNRAVLRLTELGLIASTYFIACQMKWGTSIENYY